MPRDARVEVGVAAGDVAVRDVRGGAVVRTASGDVSIKGAGGHVAVNASSGDVNVIAAEPVTLEVHSVAGDVRARAPRFERVAIETISGDAEVAGTFAATARHTISTVSGDVELAVLGGGLTIEVKTVSGDLTCHHPDRRDGDGRRRPLVIGDGAAQMSIRSMSGDVDVRAGRVGPAGARGARGARAASSTRATADPAAAPPSPLPPSPGDAQDAGTISILEALARGEIDVAEAERRLAVAPAPTVACARRGASRCVTRSTTSSAWSPRAA